MAPPPGPEFSRLSWHRVGAVGTLASLVIMGLAGLSGRLLTGISDAVFLVCAALAVLVVLRLVRRYRTPWAWLVWPGLGLALINVFHLVDPSAAKLVTGLTFLVFLFAGLTQPQGRSLFLVPLALYGQYRIIDVGLAESAVRLCVAAFGWTTTAELPALMLRRLVQQQRVLAINAETDALTGLRNRFGLEELLAELTGRAYLVLIDLDHFKRYNDTFGHLAGDALLADFAALLLRLTRSTDVVVRYGGEEFLVVLTGVDLEVVRRIAGRWSESWSQTVYDVTFSAGITDLTGSEALLRADVNLYAAKSTGRNRVVVSLAADGPLRPTAMPLDSTTTDPSDGADGTGTPDRVPVPEGL